MADVIIYSKANCPYCVHAKNLLTEKGVDFDELRIDLDPVAFAAMQEIVPNARTVPQIVIKGAPVGGFDDLKAINDAGKLDELLS
ncbi:MAG: glutaredoxin 3 [Coxiellaceae bacterium]|nr:glutaredoxin 3 [Coxiellaceae bacterium]|tara:strand:- start:5550 stop:5804 length:255 start_codon:yes stop_codon:yes gene_type:complete